MIVHHGLTDRPLAQTSAWVPRPQTTLHKTPHGVQNRVLNRVLKQVLVSLQAASLIEGRRPVA